jgi:streptogrisin B
MKRTTPHRGLARRIRLIAATSGLAAMMAFFAPSVAQADSNQSFNASQLKTASDAVLEADVAGTAWGVDKETNKVVVQVDETVSKAEIAQIRRAAGSLSGALVIERMDGELEQYMAGGQAIYAEQGWRCSLGFNVKRGGVHHFLTAGHCTNGAGWWHNGSSWLGYTVASYFPGRDFGLVQYSPQVNHGSRVYLYNGSYQTITNMANPYVGQSACRSGSTTGLRCGSVTALNQTVNYGGGDVVYGMIRTNICAEPGDSGGPLFSGSTGLGLTSGGSGNCTWGGTTFFQPVVEAMNYYGLTL